MSGRVGASCSLVVGWVTGRRPHVFIERRGGALLRVEIDEVRGLIDALADAAILVVSDAAGADREGGVAGEEK